METKKFDTNESIALIMNMVDSTKHNIAEDRIIYLLWGYAVALSAIIHYLLVYVMGVSPDQASLVWLSMPALGIIQGVYFSRKKKTKKVKTYIDRAMASIWISFIAALLAVFNWSTSYGMEYYLPYIYGAIRNRFSSFRWHTEI